MRSLGRVTLTLGIVLGAAPVVHAHGPGPQADSAAPSASDKESARQLFVEGTALEKHGDFAGALVKYEEASRRATTAGLRFHIGYCLEMNGTLTAALREYEAADKLATETGKSDVRTAVAARVGPLKARIGHLTLRLSESAGEASIVIDGQPAPESARRGDPLPVDPGAHTVTVQAAGHRPFTQTDNVSEGETKTIDVDLVPLAETSQPAPKASLSPAPRPAPHGAYTGPIVATAGAAALAGAGVLAFVLAGNAQADAERACPLKVSCDDERAKVRTLDAFALGGFASAAVFGAVAVVLWARTGGAADTHQTTARFVASPNGLALDGVF